MYQQIRGRVRFEDIAPRVTVLVGETRSSRIVARLTRMGWGRMLTVGTIKPYNGEPWGFDSNAFSWWLRGEPFDEAKYLRRLEAAQKMPFPPYLNAVPDLVGQGLRSLDYSCRWLERMPPYWPNYLVLQDGMTVDAVEQVISRFDGLFLGGTDRFKQTAAKWSELCRSHGIYFHYGRAGTLAKVRAARHAQTDSLDSSFPLWTNERFEDFAAIVRGEDPQADFLG